MKRICYWVFLALVFIIYSNNAFAAEKIIGTACTGDANAMDWDTIAQCNGTTFEKGPILLGSISSLRYTSTGCDTSKTGMIQWTGSAFHGCNGSSWSALGGASAGGADTQIQYNDGGSLEGSSNLTWASGTLSVTGKISVSDRISFIGLTGSAPNAGDIASVSVQVFTSSGTYTSPNGLIYAIVEVVGGGGSGGSASTTTAAAGGGGGGGGYAREVLSASTIGSSQTVTVGTGGAASGNSGGTSSFGSLLSAAGGSGGTNVTTAASGAGGSGGAGSSGDVNISGADGANGVSVAATTASGGSGGASALGGGGRGGVAGVGSAGKNYGGGGGGAARSTTGTNAGGAGAGGIVIVTEFKT